MNEQYSPSVDQMGNKRRIRPKTNWRPLALIGGVALVFALGMIAGFFMWGRPLAAARVELASVKSELETLKASVIPAAGQASQAESNQADTSQPAAEGEIQQVTRYPVTEDGDPSFGPANAPITIIEFSDFECPYCQRWHAEVWKMLVAAYPSQIRLVYRDFPLYSIHPNAGPAANAAECANEQGKYWEFHDLLFSGAEKLGETAYQTYASALNMDLNAFQQCLDENRYEAEVTADFEYASSIGISSTPTFFINGVALIGAQPFEVFQEVIELELAGKLSQ
ncbi:MAG: DsbA family protein [Bellilinea sp.]